jgi:HptB-dependent secretion and biofilm anti anti-sigma factor
MKMQIEITDTATSLQVRLTGRFDFSTREQFMSLIEGAIAASAAAELRCDLGGVDYIDSSALGMLLVTRDKAKKFDKTVTLANARGMVRQTLGAAQFDQLFTIS